MSASIIERVDECVGSMPTRFVLQPTPCQYRSGQISVEDELRVRIRSPPPTQSPRVPHHNVDAKEEDHADPHHFTLFRRLVGFDQELVRDEEEKRDNSKCHKARELKR